ncbi:MAG: TraR/DksA C4-type zinc finger protein [Actinomycetota bacterium]
MAAKPFTKDELKEFRKRLEHERVELGTQLKDIEEESFSSTQAEMSGETGFDEEFADAGSFTLERESALSIENNVRDLIQKIGHALERMDDGKFGVCERCGKMIEKARIKALPYATLCIKDAQAEARLR